jgi:hypothetical protein
MGACCFELVSDVPLAAADGGLAGRRGQVTMLSASSIALYDQPIGHGGMRMLVIGPHLVMPRRGGHATRRLTPARMLLAMRRCASATPRALAGDEDNRAECE